MSLADTTVSVCCLRKASEGEYTYIKTGSVVFQWFFLCVTGHSLKDDKQYNDIMSDESEQLLALQ